MIGAEVFNEGPIDSLPPKLSMRDPNFSLDVEERRCIDLVDKKLYQTNLEVTCKVPIDSCYVACVESNGSGGGLAAAENS